MFYWTFTESRDESQLQETITIGNGTSLETTLTPSSTPTASGTASKQLKHVTEGLRSWLYYTPLSRHDFGNFHCFGRNVIGIQRDPCLFTILPADDLNSNEILS